MRYLKAYFRAFLRGLQGFGAIYLIIGVLDKHMGAFLCVYYAATVGCAGIINEFLKTPKKEE